MIEAKILINRRLKRKLGNNRPVTIINEKVLSSNFNAKLKLFKKCKRKNKKVRNFNKNGKNFKHDFLKEISIDKFNCENKISFKNIKNTFFKNKENRGNICPHINNHHKICTFKEILNEMDKMKVNTASNSHSSISTCISSNINSSVNSSYVACFIPNTFKEYDNFIFNSINGCQTNSNKRAKFNFIDECNENNYFLCIKPRDKRRNDLISQQLRINKIYKCYNKEKYFNNKKIIQPYLIDEIYNQMLLDEKEEENLFNLEEYSKIQTDINEKMRAVLIDWLVEVHKLFELIPETLFLAVHLIDRYLCKKLILKQKLQLLGITSLWIACKYLDVLVIDLKYCVYVTDNTYTAIEIKQMEIEILSTLNFTITSSSLLEFYDLLSVNFCLKERVYYMGRYLLEIFLLDTSINKYKKSLVACSVIYLALKISNEDSRFKTIVKSYTEEDKNNLKECAKQILYLNMNIHQLGLKGIPKKFAGKEFCEVSKIENNKF